VALFENCFSNQTFQSFSQIRHLSTNMYIVIRKVVSKLENLPSTLTGLCTLQANRKAQIPSHYPLRFFVAVLSSALQAWTSVELLLMA
jgi:hypothetical protein